MATVKLLFVSIGIILAGIYTYNLLYWQAPKPFIADVIWKTSDNPDDKTISPFTINIPQQDLEYLKQRLRNTSLTPPLQGIDFEYGMNTEKLQGIIDYWANKYDWKKREKLLNSVPHFRTRVSGLNIHFIRVKPDSKLAAKKRVLPLLLLHGWPGSVREFYPIFSLLTIPRQNYDFVFEVVAPSLPGYGFSDAATKPGLNPAQIALIMKKLMNKLGFKRFYVQGGDWGAAVGNHIAAIYPESVLGFHSNMCAAVLVTPLSVIKLLIGTIFPRLIVDARYEHKVYPLSELIRSSFAESGYLHIQATKPDTVGVGLTDSPAGLAAYILEKFVWSVTWQSPAKDVVEKMDMFEGRFTINDLLDNVMIYWSTKSITSSMRLYAEFFSDKYRALYMQRLPIFVPTVCAFYPQEVIFSPESIVTEKFKKLLHVSHMPRGGHFAAFEEPELFADDLWKGICIIENHTNSTQRSCSA